MIFDNLVNAVRPKVATVVFGAKEKSPEILLAAGIGAGVASAVMLAKAHKKSGQTFDEVVDEIHSLREYALASREPGLDIPEESVISVERENQTLVILYTELVRRGLVLYGPSILLGASSLALILASHNALRSRNRALLGVVAILQQSFSEYRKRVVSELGPEMDKRFYYGTEARTVTTIEEVDGKKKKSKAEEEHLREEITPIMYQRVFDETNQNWHHDIDRNRFFLAAVQQQMNDRLYLDGVVMLNDVYEALGFSKTPEGQIVGWARKAPGDGVVTFGLDEDFNMREGDNRMLLDFNVAGPVFEFIGEK